MSDCGKRLVWLRASTGLTQQQFAGKARISARSLSTWENDDGQPSHSNVELLAKFFKIPVAELSDFLAGKGKLTTIPATMQRWLNVPVIGPGTTLGDLNKLMDEYG